MNSYATSYPKYVLQTVWRRLRKPARPHSISYPEAYVDPTSRSKPNPHDPPKVTCGSKATRVLGEIVRASELGYASLPPSLLNQAREALRR